jgi:hypothetical protein
VASKPRAFGATNLVENFKPNSISIINFLPTVRNVLGFLSRTKVPNFQILEHHSFPKMVKGGEAPISSNAAPHNANKLASLSPTTILHGYFRLLCSLNQKADFVAHQQF